MVRRLDWEKAKRHDQRSRARPARKLSAKQQRIRYEALVTFAAKHNLRCFKCDTDNAEWAKSGISARGPWIICVPCVNKRSAARPA